MPNCIRSIRKEWVEYLNMSIKLVHISDTHLQLFPELPEADILIHTGDALNYGSFQELISFREQLNNIQHLFKHLIFVPGNHDKAFEKDFKQAETFLKETVSNLIILHNSSAQILGLNFYGTADQPQFFNWAFNKSEQDLINSYNNIPEDTNVLLTHCPPKGTLDYVCNQWNPKGNHVGSLELALRLKDLKHLKLHCFGHIHFSSGQIEQNGIIYSNGSICNEQYQPTNQAQLIELT